MRLVIQRVKSASVEVDGQVVSSIGPGLLCLVGIKDSDTDRDQELLVRKILRPRLWPDEESGKAWQLDVAALGGEVLLVSQFTLYGRLKKPKPDYSKAMGPQEARKFYEAFVERVRREYGHPDRVKDGVFGAMMQVSLQNDGPVTFIVDSDKDEA